MRGDYLACRIGLWVCGTFAVVYFVLALFILDGPTLVK